MAEQQGNEFDEVGIQDIIELMTSEVAKATREKVVEQAKVKRLIGIVEEARGHIEQLNDEVQRLTAIVEGPKARKAPRDRAKPQSTKPAEDTVPGELVDEAPAQD